MFGKKTGQAGPVAVTTGKELEKAVKTGTSCIEVRGRLVKKLKWIRKLKPAAAAALLPLLAARAASMSLFAAPVALPVSLAVAGITAADISLCTISAAVLLAVIKDYNIEAGSDESYIRFIKKQDCR